MTSKYQKKRPKYTPPKKCKAAKRGPAVKLSLCPVQAITVTPGAAIPILEDIVSTWNTDQTATTTHCLQTQELPTGNIARLDVFQIPPAANVIVELEVNPATPNQFTWRKIFNNLAEYTASQLRWTELPWFAGPQVTGPASIQLLP